VKVFYRDWLVSWAWCRTGG